MTSEGRNDPKVRYARRPDSDFTAEVDVELAAGQRIYATRDPVWLSEGLATSPVDGGTCWNSPGPGMLRFGTGSGVDVVRLDVAGDGSVLVVAAELILLWTGDAQFGSPELPGISGLAQVSGDGRLWMLVPGYRSEWPHRLRSSQRFPAVVNLPTRSSGWSMPPSTCVRPVAGLCSVGLSPARCRSTRGTSRPRSPPMMCRWILACCGG